MKHITQISTKDAYEAMEAGDHNYTVDMVPITLPDGTEVWDKKAVIRKDTGTYLGTVGKDYQPVQPVAVYEMAHTMLAETGGEINAVVNMHRGAVFGVSLHLNRSEYLPGDPVDLDFLLLASHNGMYGILGRALSRRLLCMNQVPSSKHLFNLKHTRFVENRLDVATKMLSYYHREIDSFNHNMRQLVKYRMSENLMVEWFSGLFPNPPSDSKRANSILENTKATFIELLASGKGTNVPGLRGTGWHAFNALTEFANYERTTRVKDGRDEAEVRFEAINFGSANNLMQKGLARLLDMVHTDSIAPIMVR